MTVSSVSLLLMVAAPCLGPYKATQGRFCTNLQWICPKSTVTYKHLFLFLHSFTFEKNLNIYSATSGRGGQSALRFARLRMEKRHNYVRKVAETAVQLFVSNDKVNVAGLVLAGSADFKTELSQSDMFDPVCLPIM